MKKIIRLTGAIALACLWVAGPLAQTTQTTGQTALPPLPDALTLEAAAERFLQRNLSVEAARLEVGVAEAERITASFWPRP